MILDHIDNAAIYAGILPGLKRAVKFIKENEASIAPGKYILDEDRLFVMLVETDLKTPEAAALEVHNRYVDVQVVLSEQCQESYGWAQRSLCTAPRGEFDPEGDFLLFDDAPEKIITLQHHEMIIFFPSDSHAPLIGQGKIRKAIIKILIPDKEA